MSQIAFIRVAGIWNLLQAKVLQSFENAGYVQFVSRPSGEMPPSYHLLIDIRQFQISDVEKLSAQVQLLVKVIDQCGRILKGRSIMIESAATSREPIDTVSALNEAFAQAMRELIPWVDKAISAGTAPN